MSLTSYRLSNGGFYPQKQTAEFTKNVYVNSLRYYRKPSTPADFTRPKTTKGARENARTTSSSVRAA